MNRPRVTLVTFATESFKEKQKTLKHIGFRAGWRVEEYNPARLSKIDLNFYNSLELEATPGYGYWAWKPRIILDSMSNLERNEIVMYIDSGDLFLPNIVDIYGHYLEREPYVFFGGQGKIFEYCKMESIAHFNCDSFFIGNKPMIEAGISFWRNCTAAHRLLQDWLQSCQITHIIDDSIDVSLQKKTFKSHKHDQSLLSILVAKNRGKVIPARKRRSFECNI